MAATRRVGVRELKNNAPRLVRRAAEGERIIILRYGRPEAILGPVDDPEAAGEDVPPQVRAWQRERLAFERLTPKRIARYRGRFVAIRRGRVVDSDADHNRLFERMWQRHAGSVFFIGRVGAPPSLVDMPGFDTR